MAADEEDDDALAGEMPELDELTLPEDDPARPPLDPKVVARFLSKQRALDIAATAIRQVVPAQQAEDLAADAVVRAFRARPPRAEKALPAWLSAIASRVAARWLEKRKRRAKYEGAMPVRKDGEDAYTGHAIEDHAEPVRSFLDEENAAEAEDLIDDFLESIVAPHDRALLDLLRERAAGKKTYATLAAERNMSVDQLDRRIRRFKTKYGPRVRKRRNTVLLWQLGGGIALGAAIVIAWILWVLFHPRPPHAVVPDPATQPLPSATASAEAPLVASPTQLMDAKELRDSAFAECRASRWAECLRRLDAAKTLDPAGDDAPEVQKARIQAQQALERK